MKIKIFTIGLVALFAITHCVYLGLATAEEMLEDEISSSQSSEKVVQIEKYSRKKKTRKPRKRKARKRRSSSREEAVDLSKLGGYSKTHAKAENSQPNFKMIFDLLLALRQGVHPLSFDNYHTLFLVEFIPMPGLEFGFEVSTSPRYFELKYDLTSNLKIRLGKIWIPFDQMDPHNQFGGWMNTSELLPSNGEAFLPDIWADLGVGFQYNPIDTRALSLVVDGYVVNGFQGGKTDPLGGSNDYPDFSTTTAPDNNTDKAFGGRGHLTFFRRLGIGASFYTGLFTDEEADTGRITMIGLDSQFRLEDTSLKAGYVGMNVTLPEPARTGFIRGGLYGEIAYRFNPKWQAKLRGGVVQNDNRVTDVTDRTLIGATVIYGMGPFLLSAEHFRDLNKVAGKVGYTFYAGRFSLIL